MRCEHLTGDKEIDVLSACDLGRSFSDSSYKLATMPPKKIQSIQLKVDRAQRHINSLGEEITKFLDTQPFKVATRAHPQLPYATVFYLESAADIPTDLPIIAGDVIQNLRSALDHLAWQLVEASGGIGDTGTGFPIFDRALFKSQKEEERFFTRKIGGMRQEIQDAIRNTSPFKGGNDILWAIHNINNIDKHRLLITVGFTTPKFAVKAGQFHATFPLAGWYPLEVGETIVTIPRELEPIEYPEFLFEMVLGEAGPFQDKPLLDMLQTMHDEVENLTRDFLRFLR